MIPPAALTPPVSMLLAGQPATAWTLGAPMEVPKATLRSIETFGHLAERFLAARQVFLKRAAKPGQFDEIKPWLAGFSAEDAPVLDQDGTFVSMLTWQNDRLRIHTLVLDGPSAAKALELSRLLDGESPTAPLLTTPAGASASLWPALVRLRPLREFWERELGRSHWDTLCALLPESWVLTPDPLPPGAVIPGLELASWDEFVDVISSPQSYHISSAGEPAQAGRLASAEEIRHALEAYPAPVSVLTEKLAAAGQVSMVGVYKKEGKKTVLVQVLALQEPFLMRKVLAVSQSP